MRGLQKLMGNWSYEVELTGDHLKQLLRQARTQKTVFQISIDEVWDVFLDQHGQCPFSAFRLDFGPTPETTTAYLDRLDRTNGYVKGNVRWLHKGIGQMKANLTDQELVAWVKRLAWVSRSSAAFPPYRCAA